MVETQMALMSEKKVDGDLNDSHPPARLERQLSNGGPRSHHHENGGTRSCENKLMVVHKGIVQSWFLKFVGNN